MEQQLFGLMAVAEEQQKAVQAAIEGLKTERAEIRKTYSRELIDVTNVALDNAAEAALEKFSARATELTEEMEKASKAISDVLEKTNTRHLMYIAKAVALAFVLLFVLMVAGAAHTSYLRSELAELVERKATLKNEVAELDGQVAALAKRGGRIVYSTCNDGDKVRLCIAIATNQGFGQPQVKGVYANKTTGQTFVIPEGY